MLSRRRAVTLLATAVVALAAPAGAHASAQTSACPGADVVPAAGNLAQISQATLCLLNDERAAAGLRPLQYSAALTVPSAAYSTKMVTQNFFAHESPDGSTLTSRLTAAGYIKPDGDWFFGETPAWGQATLATARSIAITWMNSAGHRHNILEPDFTEVGIGIVPGTPGDPSWGATYTTDFGNVTHDAQTASAVASAASAVKGTSARSAAKKKAAKRFKVKTVLVRASKAKDKKATTKRVTTCATTSAKARTRAKKRS